MMSFVRSRKPSNLWDFDAINPLCWYSLHPQASRTSVVTIATGVSNLTDVSGNGYTVIQGIGANQPLYSATSFNGFPTLTFDGTNDVLETSVNFPLSGNPNFTVIAVYKKNLSARGSFYGWGNATNSLQSHGLLDSGGNGIFAYTSGSNYEIPSIDTNPLILSYHKPAGAINLSTAYRNGVLQSPVGTPSANTPNIALLPLRLGRRSTSTNAVDYLNGHLSEFVAFNRLLTTDERQRAEGILAHRWWRLGGVAVTLADSHPFRFNPPER